MKTKKVFYSFHYANDSWRVNQIRNIGSISDNKPIKANDWEKIQQAGTKAVEAWIEGQLKYKCCTIVLVGSETYSRRWVLKEIMKSWNKGKGVFGIDISELKCREGKSSKAGMNPFAMFELDGKSFDGIVEFKTRGFFDRLGTLFSDNPSKDTYSWISNNLESWIEESIQTRRYHSELTKLKLKKKT